MESPLACYEKISRAVAESVGNANTPVPVTPEARAEIRRRLFKMMKVQESWLPEITWEKRSSYISGDVETETLRFTSWQDVWGDATLYLPRKRNNPVPAMLFSPGHAMDTGRFQAKYQIMAQLLAQKGCAVLLFDQFGMGERIHTGHSRSFAPFACGTTVIGLMILEGMALFNALSADERIDSSKVGIMGHSGGGQNTLFLAAALQNRAAQAVSSGWACSFEYNSRKERRLCPCDIFPGILHEFEVWHAIGCLYPNPIMCCSGMGDPMIARDVVLQLKHRLEAFYAPGKSEIFLWNGGHQWGNPTDFTHVADFILKNFELSGYGDALAELPEPFFPAAPDAARPPYPESAIDLGELASRLTGIAPGNPESVTQVFPKPEFLTEAEFNTLAPETREYFTQIAAFL